MVVILRRKMARSIGRLGINGVLNRTEMRSGFWRFREGLGCSWVGEVWGITGVFWRKGCVLLLLASSYNDLIMNVFLSASTLVLVLSFVEWLGFNRHVMRNNQLVVNTHIQVKEVEKGVHAHWMRISIHLQTTSNNFLKNSLKKTNTTNKQQQKTKPPHAANRLFSLFSSKHCTTSPTSNPVHPSNPIPHSVPLRISPTSLF